MNKLLSIIVPVYNTQDYLSRCLDSLCVPQYLEQIEVIVVIDGSPDQSITIANGYKERYPETFIVINKENGGHGSTINVGLEHATGKYFRVLDSDDWYNTKNLKIFIDKLQTEDADLVMTHMIKEYPNGNSLYEQPIKEHNRSYFVKDIITKIDHRSFAMGRCTYKTEKLKEYGLKLLEKQSYEDTFLHIFPLVFLKSFICYDMVIYHYFLDRPEQSVHQKITKKHCTSWKNIINQMCTFYLKYKDVFTQEVGSYILSTIGEIVDNHYVRINELPYFEAKKELATYHKEVKSLPIYKEIERYKGKYYKKTPFFIFRISKQIWNCICKLKNISL